MNYLDELQANISDLVKKTENQKFEWVRENPTTFYCEVEREIPDSIDSKTKSFLISVQKILSAKKAIIAGDQSLNNDQLSKSSIQSDFEYILQIKDIKLDQTIFKINTLENSHKDKLYDSFSKLYETIEVQAANKTLDVFKMILGK